MKGQEVVLTDILACRERRVNIQNEYIQRYHCPVISFCMNIPGPIKTNEQIKKAFLSFALAIKLHFLLYYKKRTFRFLPKLSLMRRLEMKLFLQSTIRQIKLKN